MHEFVEKILGVKLTSYQKDLITKFKAAPKGSRLAIVRPRNLRLIK